MFTDVCSGSVFILAFPDDAAMFSANSVLLLEKLALFSLRISRSGLSMNVSETKFMCFHFPGSGSR